MNVKPNDPVSTPVDTTLEAKQAALIARRRLMRGGLGVAPVLLVSAPRSVMAATCKTASATTSLNPSGAIVGATPCNGKTPERWVGTSLTVWPGTCLVNTQQTMRFDDIFGSTNGYGNARLLDVLGFSAATGKDALAKYTVAALLNARAGFTSPSVLSETIVRNIWDACRGGGFYVPTATVRWHADYSVPAGSGGSTAWLKSTMS